MITLLLFVVALLLAFIATFIGAVESLGGKTRESARAFLFNHGPGILLPKSKSSRAHYYLFGISGLLFVIAVVRLFL
jgi:hypothetical protein